MRQILSPKNRKRTEGEFLRYFLVGALGFGINLLIISFLTEFFRLFYIFSAVAAFIIAGISNFTLDKTWTFKENLEKRYFEEYVLYLSFSIVALVVNLLILYSLTEFAGIFYLYSQILAVLVSGTTSFTLNELYNFKLRRKKG